MAEQNSPYKLPSFPTEFTETDQTRLTELDNQRKTLEDLYSQHFLPDVWSAKPGGERFLRSFGSLVGAEGALHALRGVIPGEALQWGLTPETARTYRLAVEGEYEELKRRQKVSIQSANIVNDVRLLALMGEPIQDVSDLLRRFPELGDWKDEEVAYITSFAQSLIGKTPDEILRATAGMPEITPEMIQAAFTDEPSKMPPEYILSSVAFTKDLSAIKDALTAAFPPQPDEPISEEETEQTKSALLNSQEEQDVALGITPEPGESLADTMQRKHELIAAGHEIVLQDFITGMRITGTITEGRMVWVDDELIGYLDEETNTLLAVGIDGTIFHNVYEEEYWLKDKLIDPFLVGAVHPITGMLLTASTMTTALLFMLAEMNPWTKPIFDIVGLAPEEVNLMRYWETFKGKILAADAERFLRQAERNREWWAEHPEFSPKPLYEESPWENPELFKDPGWITYTITNSLAYSLGVMGTIAIVTMATGGNVPAGLGAGFIMASGPEASSMTEELLAAGVPFDEAVKWGYLYGTISGFVETASDIPLLGLVLKPFRGITASFWNAFKKRFATRALQAIMAGIVIDTIETVEEIVTSVAHDAILDIYTDMTAQEYLSNISNTAVRAAIASTPFALWGGGSSYRNFKGSLSAQLLAKLDAAEAKFTAAGANPAEAQVLAVKEVMMKDEADADSIASALDAFRREHDTFVSMSPEEQASAVAENSQLGVQELQIAVAHLQLVEKEREFTENQLETFKETPGEEPAAALASTQRRAELEAKLEALNQETSLMAGRADILRSLLSESPDTASEVAVVEPSSTEVLEQYSAGKITRAEYLEQTGLEDVTFENEIAHLHKLAEGHRWSAILDYITGLKFEAQWMADHVEAAAHDVRARAKSPGLKSNEYQDSLNRLLSAIDEIAPPVPIRRGTIEILNGEIEEAKTTLAGVQSELKLFIANRQQHLDRAAALVESKGSVFEIQTEKESIDSLNIEITLAKQKETDLTNQILETANKLMEAEQVAAGKTQAEGKVMPEAKQKQLLAEAQVLLAQDPNAAQKGLHIIPVPEGEVFIVTNAKGEVLAAGHSIMSKETGKLTLSVLVAKDENGAPAARTIIAYIEERDLAFSSETEMSPKALRAYKKYQARQDAAPKGAAVTGAGWTQDMADRIATEDVARAIKSRFVPNSEPQTVDGVPTINTWDEERLGVTEALKSNKTIAEAIVNPIIREAGRIWDAMTKEQRLEWAEKNPRINRQVAEDISEKNWSDLPPTHRETLTLHNVPDNSVRAKKFNLLWDKRYIFQWLQEKTGKPFYSLFKRIEMVHAIANQIRDTVLDKIDKNPEFRALLRDKAALMRIEQEITSRNTDLNVEAPTDLTDAERRLADVFESIFRSYEPKVRYLRFLREYEQTGSLDGVYNAIVGKMKLSPVEEALIRGQLQQCIDYYNLGDYEGLWAYIQDKEWGVVNSGYTPWMIVRPNLFPRELPLSSTRGAARLMHRERVDFPSGMRTFVQRFGTYVRQIETYFYLRPELKLLDTMLKEVSGKLDSKTNASTEANMRSLTRELQGLPSEDSHRTSVIRRVYRQAMAAVFVHPYLSFRNLHQHLAFFPDRSELFRYLVDRPPAAFREKMDIFYNSVVSQMSAIRRDYMFTEEQSLPGLGVLARLAHRLSAYPLSDNIPRRWSCYAAANKAHRAAMQFLKDGDINKWKNNSGVLHLTQTEQNYALELLSRDSFNFGVKGIRDTTGAEASSLFIGHEVANMTHFVYDRAFRAEIEQGETGRILFNLLVFPRSYALRLVVQGQKLGSKEASAAEKRMAFKDIALMLIVGAMISEWLARVTGRPRRSYNPFDIIRWDLGGLALGVGREVFSMIGLLSAAVSPTTDSEYKKQVMAQIPGVITRNALVLVPFYKTFIDSIEAITEKENVDLWALKQLRGWLDKNYTAAELESLEMTLQEKFAKAILGGQPSDPDIFIQGQSDVMNRQAELGQVNAVGRFYTLRNFVTDIEASIKGIPDDMLTPEYGWSELTLYYIDYREQWQELQEITSIGSARENYRLENPDFNVWLCFWGFYSSSLYKVGSPGWNDFLSHIASLFDYHGIDATMHGEWADWTLPIVPRA